MSAKALGPINRIIESIATIKDNIETKTDTGSLSETIFLIFVPIFQRFFSKKNQSMRITANAKTAIPVVM
ncbi:hypothetical protein HOK09_00650, partial [Candidatus Woesearchaeota archaeon]|nr:hypothetical protein [Candidatus Woesearchaeota archaeon]